MTQVDDRPPVDLLGVDVLTGPVLLSAIDHGPGLAAHRAVRGDLPVVALDDLERASERIDLHGRGGAGFPFADKLRAVKGARRAPVVVNVCEGEPFSAKDSALAVRAPHLVLDGAVLAARALRSGTVHIAVPTERPDVVASVARAIQERPHRDDRVRFRLHLARPGFVSGQSRAVVELIEGRENVPVTATKPVSTSGLRGRPTLLSNAETFAHLAAAVLRPPAATGRYLRSTLLTIADGVGRPRVLEVLVGTSWSTVLTPEALQRPVLLGGYHGRWAAPGALTGLTVARNVVAAHGLVLGAGVVLVPDGCPLVLTARIAEYLAEQSAGRCGPCRFGLPALAESCRALVEGTSTPDEVARLASMVTGRGACAHPDGTAVMVASALDTFGDEITRHTHGVCRYQDGFGTSAR